MSSIGVFASLFDVGGRILLVRQAYGSRRWTTPGGRVEEGESPLGALEREALEEIACEVRIAHLIGVYSKPYRDDLILSFAVTLVRGTPQPCLPEVSDIAFFAREAGDYERCHDGTEAGVFFARMGAAPVMRCDHWRQPD